MLYANRIILSLCLCMGAFTVNYCSTKETERTKMLIKSEEVSYPSNKIGHKAEITISGTLTTPMSGEPAATVILVPGYGPNDRDYTLMGHKRFLVVAEYLAQNGIAVLRFDKRGVCKSTGDYACATSRDFADDVLAGIEYLKSRKDLESTKIGLAGHSEGGMISSMVAAQSSDVKFVVLMAGVVQADINGLVAQTAKQLKADGASDELLAQNHKLRTQIFTIITQDASADNAKFKLEKLLHDYCNNLPEAIKLESEKIPFAITESKIDGMVSVFNSPWYRYFLRCKPENMLAQIKVRVLALYGDRDWITSSQPSLSIISGTLKSAGNFDVTAIEFPNLNHSLQTCKTGALGEYASIEETIAPAVLKSMSDWILNRK